MAGAARWLTAPTDAAYRRQPPARSAGVRIRSMSSGDDAMSLNRLEAARHRLTEAVGRLERAMARHDAAAGEAGSTDPAAHHAAWADYEALRSVTATVSDRLDHTIDRLKAVLER
jgi:hypothetical protein